LCKKSRQVEEYHTYCEKKRKAIWICHILGKNYLLKHVIEGTREGRVQVMGRPRRRRKQLLDDLKESIL